MNTDTQAKRLAPREIEVVKAIAEGKTNKEIAAQMALTEGTVKQYVSRAMETLGFTNRTQLAAYIIRTLG